MSKHAQFETPLCSLRHRYSQDIVDTIDTPKITLGLKSISTDDT